MNKKFALMIAGLGIAAATVPAATAQAGWQNINQRQAQLEQRIDQGLRTGQLTRAEATRLRAEYRGIAQLEVRYRRSAPGLTTAERRDLDNRFDVLSRKIRFERQDSQNRPGAADGWQNINQRQAQLEQRINQGLRNGQLTRAEATRLRAEYRGIAQLEMRYRRSAPGLTMAERRDLDRRFDVLSRKIRIERQDQNRPGADNGWWNINQRQAVLDRRIDQGLRSGQLTRAEAVRLRAEFRGIAMLETRYRQSRPGLTMAERADLDRRFDVLARKIRWERRDWEQRR